MVRPRAHRGSLAGAAPGRRRLGWLARSGAVLAASGLIAGCQGDPQVQQTRAQQSQAEQFEISEETFLDLFRTNVDPQRTIQVNRFIWAASLDTLSFLPLEGADPFSGVIVTAWGQVPGDPTPYRVTVLVTDAALDARSLRVAAFRQQGGRAVPVGEAENRQLENAILTRARQMRIAQSGR